jgi:capsular polysaccharide biosynthesis protein
MKVGQRQFAENPMATAHEDIDLPSIEDINCRFAKYEQIIGPLREPDGSLAGPFIPEAYGFPRADNEADLAESAYLVLSIKESTGRFRLISLGAAPGEWAIRAERLYAKVHGGDDYLSVSVEADLGHIEIMQQFFTNNKIDRRKNVILYAAIADINGWAYMPVINPTQNWGCGTVAVSDDPTQLDGNIRMSATAKQSTEAVQQGQPIEYCAVMAISLDWLLGVTGIVDYLQCDIQGAEGTIFNTHIGALGSKVRRCCISIHGQRIEDKLMDLFGANGWILEAKVPGRYVQDGEFEDSHGDGVLIWRNPHLTTSTHKVGESILENIAQATDIVETDEIGAFVLEGSLGRLIDLPQLAINGRTLNVSPIYWTDNSSRPQVSLFLARLGKCYITTCFIPLSVRMNALFIDQTYGQAQKFYSLAATIDNERNTFACPIDRDAKRYDGPAILVGGSPENNWYHWTLNWVPRLVLVRQLCPEFLEDPSVRFVFHTNVRAEPYRSIINLFGIDENRMIYIDVHGRALFEHLIIPTFADESFYYPELMRACRSYFLSTSVNSVDTTALPKRFFISRENMEVPKRRVANFSDFTAVLRNFDIEVVQLERMSGVEQVELFRHAELVVGVHGAGLANILYCPPSCRVIILDNERNINSGMTRMFSVLAQILGTASTVIKVDEQILDGVDYTNFTNLHCRDVIVDTNTFRKVVEKILMEISNSHRDRNDVAV